MMKSLAIWILGLAALWGAGLAPAVPPQVELVRLPAGGIQPQLDLDKDGSLHAVYARPGGDIFYVRRDQAGGGWTHPLKVNSGEGRARGGTIAAAQMAVGANGTVHVVWINDGLSKIYYAQRPPAADSFSPQRNLLPGPMKGLEAGPSVAVAENQVVVSWHAGDFSRETDRDIVVARSSDGGKAFSMPAPVGTKRGACACCGMDSMFADDGRLFIFYRAARGGVDRDMVLLTSDHNGHSFDSRVVHPWSLNACPVSINGISAPSSPVLTWETEGRVFLAGVESLHEPVAITDEGSSDEKVREKNPTLASNASGSVLVAWGEGFGFRSGGPLKWRIFDAEGEPLTEVVSTGEKIPDHSMAAAVARPDGGFVIVY